MATLHVPRAARSSGMMGPAGAEEDHAELGAADTALNLSSEPLKLRAVFIAALACVSGLMLGYDIGISNAMLLPVSRHFDMDLKQVEFFTGMLNMAALPGCLAGGTVADRVGRRLAIVLGAMCFLVGNGLMASAWSYVSIVCGRMVAGVAVGLTLVTEPLYTAEIAPARLRGRFGSNVEVSFNVGILTGYIMGWAFSGLPDTTSWRWMLGVSLAGPLFSLLGVATVLPESPRWLARQGRLPEAKAVLDNVYGPLEASVAYDKLERGIEVKDSGMGWHRAFTSGEVRWLLFAGSGVAFFSQAAGIETIMYYSTVILMRGGMSMGTILQVMIVLGCIKVLAIMVNGKFVDECGRKPLLLISSVGMGMSMLFIAAAFHHQWSAWTKAVPMFTFIVGFSLGFGPIVYIMNTELYPKEFRAMGCTLAIGVNRVTAAVVASTFLSLADVLGFPGAFLLFAAIAFLGAGFVATVVPETKGMQLEDQEQLYKPCSTDGVRSK